MKFSTADERILQRFLDGELAPEEAAAYAARLAAEPDLQRHFAAKKAMRSVLVSAGRVVGPAPTAGFTAGVLAATRRLPSRHEMEQSEVSAGLVRFCQRLVIAAAVLLCLGLLWHSGLFDRSGSDRLQAAPEDIEVEREMQRLDALINAGVLERRSK